MKRKLLNTLMLGLLTLGIASCSNEKPTLDELYPEILGKIEITYPHDKIGVGQFVSLTFKPNNGEIKDLRYYGWKIDKKELYGDTVLWIPERVGEHTINLTIGQKYDITSEFKTHVSVSYTDYRLCFWGQSMADIMLNETANALYYYEKTNDPVTSYLPEFIFYKDLKDPTIFYAYYFDRDLNVIGGAEQFTKQYPYSSSQQYYIDYQNILREMRIKYGLPESNKIIWKDGANEDTNNIGKNIVDGNCRLETTWDAIHTKVRMSMKHKGYDDVDFQIVYHKNN